MKLISREEFENFYQDYTGWALFIGTKKVVLYDTEPSLLCEGARWRKYAERGEAVVKTKFKNGIKEYRGEVLIS